VSRDLPLTLQVPVPPPSGQRLSVPGHWDRTLPGYWAPGTHTLSRRGRRTPILPVSRDTLGRAARRLCRRAHPQGREGLVDATNSLRHSRDTGTVSLSGALSARAHQPTRASRQASKSPQRPAQQLLEGAAYRARTRHRLGSVDSHRRCGKFARDPLSRESKITLPGYWVRLPLGHWDTGYASMSVPGHRESPWLQGDMAFAAPRDTPGSIG